MTVEFLNPEKILKTLFPPEALTEAKNNEDWLLVTLGKNKPHGHLFTVCDPAARIGQTYAENDKPWTKNKKRRNDSENQNLYNQLQGMDSQYLLEEFLYAFKYPRDRKPEFMHVSQYTVTQTQIIAHILTTRGEEIPNTFELIWGEPSPN